MKDINFIEINKDMKNGLVRLDKETCKQLKTQIASDVEVFRSFRIMDYSLLLVVEQLKYPVIPEELVPMDLERNNRC